MKQILEKRRRDISKLQSEVPRKMMMLYLNRKKSREKLYLVYKAICSITQQTDIYQAAKIWSGVQGVSLRQKHTSLGVIYMAMRDGTRRYQGRK